MDIVVGPESSIPTPASGYRTLFIDTDKNNQLYYKLPDGTFEPFSGDPTDDMTEIAECWSRALGCALSAGSITASEYQAIIAQGLQVTSSSSVVNGVTTTTVNIGSRTTALLGITVDSTTITVAPAGTHQVVVTFNPPAAAGAVTYVSKNPSIATVSSTGLITGVGTGQQTTVHVIPNSDPSKIVDITVNVS